MNETPQHDGRKGGFLDGLRRRINRRERRFWNGTHGRANGRESWLWNSWGMWGVRRGVGGLGGFRRVDGDTFGGGELEGGGDDGGGVEGGLRLGGQKVLVQVEARLHLLLA